MGRVMCDSPSKNSLIQESWNCTNSPATYGTPVRQNVKKQRQNSITGGTTGFNVLPVHITPPLGLTKFIARNPFDADLTSRLHLSVISPTVFTKVSPTTSRNSPGFSWSVDDLALIQPAKIEEFPTQQTHSNDPDIEIVAQAAINKFFTAERIVPSPWDVDRKGTVAKSEMRTPSRPLEDLNVTRDTLKSKKDCWTQTVLTLPSVLPKEVEEVLKPYFTFNQDQNIESEDANSSNNSLRRKLFFNHEDCTEDEEEETSFSLSSMKSYGSMILHSSPPQGGTIVHGTPLRERSFGSERTPGTPYAGNLSPPNMSPICSNNDMSCQSIRSRCQFSARFDFTADMSIDVSIHDDRELKRIEDAELDEDTSLLRSKILKHRPTISGEIHQRTSANEEICAHNATAEMLSRESTPAKLDAVGKSLIKTRDNNEIHEIPKLTDEWWKVDSNDYQQNNTILGNSCSNGQRSDVNSAQDTGYQTYSMSNITENTENSGTTALARSGCNFNEKILSNGDEIRLSDWQDNMKNIFSSTPSKYSRQRDN